MVRVRFTALHIIATLHKIAALLVVLTVVMVIIVARLAVSDELLMRGQNFRIFVAASGSAFVSSLVVAIGLFAVAELLTCFTGPNSIGTQLIVSEMNCFPALFFYAPLVWFFALCFGRTQLT